MCNIDVGGGFFAVVAAAAAVVLGDRALRFGGEVAPPVVEVAAIPAPVRLSNFGEEDDALRLVSLCCCLGDCPFCVCVNPLDRCFVGVEDCGRVLCGCCCFAWALDDPPSLIPLSFVDCTFGLATSVRASKASLLDDTPVCCCCCCCCCLRCFDPKNLIADDNFGFVVVECLW